MKMPVTIAEGISFQSPGHEQVAHSVEPVPVAGPMPSQVSEFSAAGLSTPGPSVPDYQVTLPLARFASSSPDIKTKTTLRIASNF